MSLFYFHTLGIQPRLLQKLERATECASDTLSIQGVVPQVRSQTIPLQRGKDTDRILYICAIALKLAKVWQHSPMEIATAIAAHLSESSVATARTTVSDRLDFTVNVVPPGWIHLELTDPAIASWLQRLTQCSGDRAQSSIAHPQSLPIPEDSTALFQVQYAHARCCSLLRLAHREGLITLANANPTPKLGLREREFEWHLLEPDPIPWLDPQGQLRLLHPTERALISQLVTTLDALAIGFEGSQSSGPLKFATALSQDFLTFYSENRIWGAVKTEDPCLARARLGLMSATRPVLEVLLEEALGVSAPVEL